MEKSTPKERKTRAKAAAPVQPENSDTPAENAAEQRLRQIRLPWNSPLRFLLKTLRIP